MRDIPNFGISATDLSEKTIQECVDQHEGGLGETFPKVERARNCSVAVWLLMEEVHTRRVLWQTDHWLLLAT